MDTYDTNHFLEQFDILVESITKIEHRLNVMDEHMREYMQYVRRSMD